MSLITTFDNHIHSIIEALLENHVSRTLYACNSFMLLEAPDLPSLRRAQLVLDCCGLAHQTGADSTLPWTLRVTLPND
jgi:hypothetical protein